MKSLRFILMTKKRGDMVDEVEELVLGDQLENPS